MPVTRTAKRALRRATRKTVVNVRRKRSLKKLLNQFKEKPTQKQLDGVVSQIDKATKHNLLHPNKAARLKSQMYKFQAAAK